jgi:hypothetical protein
MITNGKFGGYGRTAIAARVTYDTISSKVIKENAKPKYDTKIRILIYKELFRQKCVLKYKNYTSTLPVMRNVPSYPGGGGGVTID